MSGDQLPRNHRHRRPHVPPEALSCPCPCPTSSALDDALSGDRSVSCCVSGAGVVIGPDSSASNRSWRNPARACHAAAAAESSAFFRVSSATRSTRAAPVASCSLSRSVVCPVSVVSSSSAGRRTYQAPPRFSAGRVPRRILARIASGVIPKCFAASPTATYRPDPACPSVVPCSVALSSVMRHIPICARNARDEGQDTPLRCPVGLCRVVTKWK